jgi:enoyl-CoA hydratase/carnithine racemase
MAEASAPRIEVRLAPRGDGEIAFLRVHNEVKLNTLTRALMTTFVAEVERLTARDGLRALVLSGAGERAFIGGANIPEMSALDKSTARDYIQLVHRTCDCLRRLPVPVIARIDGYALGASLEVAVSCDLRVATTRARFGMPEVKVGIPSVVEAALIPRLVGWGRARELVMLGEIIDADTALRWGLVERVVAPEALDREVDRVVGALLAAGPRATRIQKKLTQDWESLPVPQAVVAGIDAFVRAFDTDEPRRMLSAFVDRKR